MNSKAEKTTLFGNDRPPKLCLSKSTPSIDNTYNQLEANNSPFLNGYMSPLYKQTFERENIYDRYGNGYYLKDNTLYKEDKPLFSADDKHFEMKEVTAEYIDYLDFDYSNEHFAGLKFDDETNEIVLYMDEVPLRKVKLFNEGTIVKSRVRLLDEKPYAIVIFKEETNVFKYVFVSEVGSSIQTLTWYYEQIRPNTSTTLANTIVSTTIDPTNLLIQIAKVADNTIGYTILNEYGVVSKSTNLAFHTAFVYNDAIYILKGSASGNTLLPSTAAQPQIVTTEYSSYFERNVAFQSYTQKRAALSQDGSQYFAYDEDGVLGEELDFPIAYTPTRTEESVTIGDVEYRKYLYDDMIQKAKVEVSNTATQNDADWGVVLSVGGQTIEKSASSNTATTIEVEVEIHNIGVSAAVDPTIDSVSVWLNDKSNAVDMLDKKIAYLSYTKASTTNVSWLTYPTLVFDNGKLYTAFRFNTTATALTANNQLIDSGVVRTLSLSGTSLTYTIQATEAFTLPVSAFKIRSNSYTILPNYFSTTVKGTTTTSAFTISPANGNTTTWFNSSTTPRTFLAGTHNTSEKYNSADIFDNYVCYTPTGSRAQIGNTNWNILPYIFNSDISNLGISYSKDPNTMGTILTPWTDINQDFYIKANDSFVIYKDSLDRLWKISIEGGVEFYPISHDRYIVLNTTSYFNCWDSLLNKKLHYASDYNNRIQFGYTAWNVGTTNANINIRYRATAVNAAYKQNTRLNLASSQFPTIVVSRCEVSQYILNGTTIPETVDAQTIDVYYSDTTNTATSDYTYSSAVKYRFSIYPFHIVDSVAESSLAGTSYQNNTTMFCPSIFSKIVSGAANNDFVIQNNTSYPLVYFNGSPILLYTLQSGQELNEVDSFFVLQGQFYGVVGEKIYSLIYVDNTLTEMDAIVDIRGFKFIGNTPQIAFFWSPSLRAIFSFTGDAVLQPLFAANKIDSISGDYFYDESSMSIWIPTNVGILVLSSKNTFILPYDSEAVVPKRIQFSEDGITHVEGTNTTNYSYYPKEGFESNHVVAETSFFGIGALQSTTIDRWNLVLYNPYEVDLDGDLLLKVKSITNTMTTSESKKMHISSNQWDKESKSILVSYSPQLIKGQGIRLSFDSPWIVAAVVPHIQDNGTTQATAAKFEI